MNNWILWFLLFIILICLPLRQSRYAKAKQIAQRRKTLEKERQNMKELAERFIGKDCYIKLLNGNTDGIVKEVSDSGLLIERKDGMQAVNYDYIMKIQEYPHNRKGKRKAVFDWN